MTKIHFKCIVVKTVPLLLEPLGYQFYKANRIAGDRLFFEKPSPDEEDVNFFIIFQLGQHYIPPHRRFTVELQRNKGSFAKPERGYEKTVRERLGALIWFYYKLRIYPHSSHWWEFKDDEELKIQLEDAVEKIITYGIPWLEDLDAVPPWEYL